MRRDAFVTLHGSAACSAHTFRLSAGPNTALSRYTGGQNCFIWIYITVVLGGVVTGFWHVGRGCCSTTTRKLCLLLLSWIGCVDRCIGIVSLNAKA
jgi:hypothetical protein